ncbi:hypothetical protein J31TS4_12490 [Paenibacillus sp. J31TS4]|uniref:ATP-binding protein n=1 Tax=Paenibacillus sp. J31TS4 TaxID=2807195 RepID=UPI001B1D3AE4|nr:sensor histidine kinase [Paenibacillus sp. J31TS4]GIP37969.1 hypothetical protein J31TS4_12490 [Paenibacillus sp. J31TS4]
MEFAKLFFANISTLFTLTYLANLAHKYMMVRLPAELRRAAFVLLAVLAGWTSIYYGNNLFPGVIFDLRFIPIIVAPLFVRSPLEIVSIGVGIGLARLSFGLNYAAWVGALNPILLSLLCAYLNNRFLREQRSFFYRMSLIALAVNLLNVIVLATIGVLPAAVYLSTVVPHTFPLCLFFSFFFVFLLRDFQKDYIRSVELNAANRKLEQQLRIIREGTDELMKTKGELEKKASELELSSKYKSEFLSTISHELRTPLNSVLVLSEMLAENQSGGLNAEELQFASIIHTSGKEMLEMVTSLLDLTNVEAGKLLAEPGEVNMGELQAVLGRLYAPVAAEKRILYEVEAYPGLPAILPTDERKLQQILKNLISNAFKFIESGFVRLTIRPASPLEVLRTESERPIGEWIAFSVADSGPGIPAEQQSLIFEAFRQGDGALTRRYGGIGLGLSVAREFARLLGGFIRLESEPGRGSVFTLYLPRFTLEPPKSPAG